MEEIYNIQNAIPAPGPDWWTLGGTLFTNLLTAGIAALALYKTFQEYQRQGREKEHQGREKRAQQFLELRKSYRDNAGFQDIVRRIHSGKDCSDIDLQNIVEFAAFFEDMMFLVNSNLLEPTVVFYMFGGDAIRAWDTQGFWKDSYKENKNFTLLRDFVTQAREFKQSDVAAKIRAAKL